MNSFKRLSLGLLLLAIAASQSVAADWPAYQADAQRSAISPESLTLPLQQRWAVQMQSAPAPAWPDPVKEHNRVDFDYAPQLIVADGRVYFGSSADDTLRAVDAATGQPLWHYTTGGPIRFAPAFANGKVYCASDDGYLYCLEGARGELLWKFHAAETSSLVLGNGRLISRRPLRSGVLVDDGTDGTGGTVYCVAGMWPSEGVLVHALDAETGSPRWCNDTSDTMFLAQPHAKAFSLTGIAPQGYLLATDELLLVPNGRGVPAAFDRATGEMRYFEPSDSKSHGGTWATIADGRLFNGGLVYDVASGKQIPCPESKVPLWAKQTFDYGSRQKILGYRGLRVLATSSEVYGRRTGHSLALAGNLLLEGGDDKLEAFDIHSKQVSEVKWSAPLRGQVRGIAVSDGRVFASTHLGNIYCFATAGEKETSPNAVPAVRRPVTPNPNKPADGPLRRLLESKQLSQGYAVVIGSDAIKVAELARQIPLHTIMLLPEAKVAAQRSALLAAGRNGAAACVLSQAQFISGDLPTYCSNVIVLQGDLDEVPTAELWRQLRPCGGLLCMVDTSEAQRMKLLNFAPEPALSEGSSDGVVWFERGKLPGAADWDSPNPVDTLVRWPLQLTWFGGPGPARMQDRHRSSAPTPVVAFGRYFVAGEQHVIAVDAYTGLELWSFQFAQDVPSGEKPVALTGLAANDHHAYLRLDETWVQFDAQTGKRLQEVAELPPGLDTWGRAYRRENPFDQALRSHALTDEQMPRVYYRAYGCNQILSSASVDFFRSGTLGFYDLADDSGLRNFGGMRPACSRSHNAALGIFISSEGSSGCSCTYSFQTSLALAPVKRQREEDWATYYDTPTDGQVRRVAVNLGAPGDRRDQDKTLWLNHPRPALPIVFQLPVEIEAAKSAELGPYHFDADRTLVENTKTPWVYGSGYRGLRRVTVSLDERTPFLAEDAAMPPKIDGQMAAGEWPTKPACKLQPFDNRQNRGAPNRQLVDPSQWNTQVFARHDNEALYVAFHLPNKLDRKGQVYQWRHRTTGEDAGVWIDDSYQLFLSDGTKSCVLQFGVSASGATYDARWTTGNEREDAAWDGVWQSAVVADADAFTTEMAIPWKTLDEAGLQRDHLTLNAQANWNTWQMPLRFLGSRGRVACENFTTVGLGGPPIAYSRHFKVKLHFAEPDDVVVGQRRFDVRIGDETVLQDFDILAAAKAKNVAVVREFEVTATGKLTMQLIPSQGTQHDAQGETILSGFEVEEILPPK